MAETIYTVGVQIDTSQLERGTQQARQALQGLGQAESQLERQTKSVDTASKALAATESTLARALDATEQQTRQAGGSMDQFARQTSQAGTAKKAFTGGLQAMLGPFGSVQGAAVALGGYLSGQLVRSILSAGQQMDSLQRSFKTITGSAAAGRKELQFVQQTATRLAVDVGTLAESYRSFAAASRGTALEGEAAQQVFTAVTEASTTLGLSSEQTGRALNALQQMISKGTVASEELRGQLGEALPGAFQIAARAMGVTTRELSKMLEQGQVLADDFLPKFGRQVQRELGDATGDAAKRAGSGLTLLGNAFREAGAAIAQSGLSKAIDDAAKTLALFISSLASGSQAMERIREQYRQWANLTIEESRRVTDAQLKDIERRKGAYASELEERQRVANAMQQIVRQSKAEEAGLLGVPGGVAEMPTQGAFGAEIQAGKKADEVLQKQLKGIEQFRTLGTELDRVKEQLRDTQKAYDDLTSKMIESPGMGLSKTLQEQKTALESTLTTLQARQKALEETAKREKELADKARQLTKERADEERRLYLTQLQRREGIQAEIIGLTQGKDALEAWKDARERMTEAEREAANAKLTTLDGLRAEQRQLQQNIATMENAIRMTASSKLADVGAGGFRVQDVESSRFTPSIDLQERARTLAQLEADKQRILLSPQAFEKWAAGLGVVDEAYKQTLFTMIDTNYALQAQQDEAQRTQEAFEDLADSLTGTVFSAIQELTEKGKLSFKDLATSIISDLTRILQQQFLAPKIAGWTSKALEWGLKLLGVGTGAAGLGTSLPAGTTDLAGASGGSFFQSAVGGPLRSGVTLVGESGPEAIMSRAGRAMVFPTSHPLTRMAVRAHLPGRQYGGPLPGMLGESGQPAVGEQPAMPGAVPVGTRSVVQNFYITTPDASSFMRSRGEIERAMGQAVRRSQYAP